MRGLELLQFLRGVVDVRAIPAVADGKSEYPQHRNQCHRRVCAELQRRLLHFEPSVHAREARLAEHHFLQQPFDEVRLAPPGGRRDGFRRHAVAPANRAQQSIDRRSFLRSAGQVHAAQQNLLVHPCRCEDLPDKLRKHIAQRGHLLRKGEESRAAADVPILLHTSKHSRVEPGHQLIELGRKALRRVAAQRLLVWEGNPPDLRAPFLRQIVEVLREPGDEVALRHHDVHRQLDVELLVDLVQSTARGFHVDFPPARPLGHQVLRADREDDAIQRTSRAVLPEQGQKLGPAGAVGLRVGVLRRVAAGGVEKDRFVGEPPVAIARPTDSAQRALPHPLFERELQT